MSTENRTKVFLNEELAPHQMRLVESKETRPGFLGTMYGPCADYKNPTRNNNYYSRKLWENVFKNDIVREALEDKTLIGELDHPETRLETKAVNACIVMTGYEFHDDEELLYGSFDILPTPNGRILRSLLDYGCKIGVSSRGEGDVETKRVNSWGDVNVVDENNYDFVAFDAVVLPSVKAAKPTLKESLNRESLRESLENEVNSATTISELDLIKNIVGIINLPDADSLLESVEYKSQELSKGTTGSSALLEDLEQATGEIQDLREEINRLKQELTTYKSRYYGQVGRRQKLVKESMGQKQEVNKLQEKYNISVFESSSISRKNESLEESLSKSQGKIQNLNEKIRSTCSELSKYKSRIRNLEESLAQSEKSCRSTVLEIKAHKSKIRNLEESLSNAQLQVQNLRDKVRSTSSESSDYRTKIRDLEESLSQSQEFSQSKISEIEALQSQIQTLKSQSRQELKESATHKSRLQENNSNLKNRLLNSESRYSEMRKAYINEKCKLFRIDPPKILESIKPNHSLADIDKIFESYADKIDRYKKVDFTDDKLINLLEEGTIKFSGSQLKKDEDLDQTYDFMNETEKILHN